MDLLEALRDRPHSPDLGFGPEEYRRRVGRVQQAMRDDGIDVLLISNVSNLTYLTGYDSALPSGYAVGILPDEGEIALHCSTCEAVCALESSTIRDIRLFDWHEGGDTGPQLADMLLDRGCGSKRIGVETRNPETFATGAMDAASFEQLKRRLPGAELVDASDTVMRLRLVKSAGEIAHMRRAARYTRAGLSAGIDAAGDSSTGTVKPATTATMRTESPRSSSRRRSGTADRWAATRGATRSVRSSSTLPKRSPLRSTT